MKKLVSITVVSAILVLLILSGCENPIVKAIEEEVETIVEATSGSSSSSSTSTSATSEPNPNPTGTSGQGTTGGQDSGAGTNPPNPDQNPGGVNAIAKIAEGFTTASIEVTDEHIRGVFTDASATSIEFNSILKVIADAGKEAPNFATKKTIFDSLKASGLGITLTVAQETVRASVSSYNTEGVLDDEFALIYDYQEDGTEIGQLRIADIVAILSSIIESFHHGDTARIIARFIKDEIQSDYSEYIQSLDDFEQAHTITIATAIVEKSLYDNGLTGDLYNLAQAIATRGENVNTLVLADFITALRASADYDNDDLQTIVDGIGQEGITIATSGTDDTEPHWPWVSFRLNAKEAALQTVLTTADSKYAALPEEGIRSVFNDEGAIKFDQLLVALMSLDTVTSIEATTLQNAIDADDSLSVETGTKMLVVLANIINGLPQYSTTSNGNTNTKKFVFATDLNPTEQATHSATVPVNRGTLAELLKNKAAAGDRPVSIGKRNLKNALSTSAAGHKILVDYTAGWPTSTPDSDTPPTDWSVLVTKN